MGNYDDLKCNSKSIRLTDAQLNFVNAYPKGKNFNDKLSNLINAAMSQNMEAVRSEKLEAIESLRRLNSSITDAIVALDQQVNTTFSGKSSKGVYQDKENIAKMLVAFGYVPEQELIKSIKRVNILTGKKQTMSDLAEAFKTKIYAEEPMIQNTVDKIGQALSQQELQKIPEIEL